MQPRSRSDPEGAGASDIHEVIYFVAIVWAFTAVAIISDVFMTSIEVRNAGLFNTVL